MTTTQTTVTADFLAADLIAQCRKEWDCANARIRRRARASAKSFADFVRDAASINLTAHFMSDPSVARGEEERALSEAIAKALA